MVGFQVLEGLKKSVEFGIRDHGLTVVVQVTVVPNISSKRVPLCLKIGAHVSGIPGIIHTPSIEGFHSRPTSQLPPPAHAVDNVEGATRGRYLRQHPARTEHLSSCPTRRLIYAYAASIVCAESL